MSFHQVPSDRSHLVTDQTGSIIRYRIHYEKREALRYTGHLDMQRNWERILRRAHLNPVYSQGYHPQPRIQHAAALPLGYLSLHEVADFWLVNPPPPEKTSDLLQSSAPAGLQVISVYPVDQSAPPLQTLVREAEYHAEIANELLHEEVYHRIRTMLSTASIPRERRGKKYDLRPLIKTLLILEDTNQQNMTLGMRLEAREGATGRPDEVLSALGMDPFLACITRTKLIFK